MNLKKADELFHELTRLETEELRERNDHNIKMQDYAIRRSNLTQKLREAVEG